MLEEIKKSFHQIPLFVDMLIIIPLGFTVLTGRNTNGRLLLNHLDFQFLGIIAFVSQQNLKVKPFYQGFCMSYVRFLTGAQQQPEGIAQCIYGRMNLGR